ncbi:MAG: hypothetical protein V4484_07810 [Pseudomonadota bacterium]
MQLIARTLRLPVALALALLAGPALCACSKMRLGYIDQHRPPYYLGAGNVEPENPGASVELMRAIAASAGCDVVTVRLPLLRLRAALEAGTIDAMPMDATDDDGDKFALPINKSGKLDRDKALRFNTVVFVRAGDQLPRDTDPADYFKTRALGLNHGAAMALQLRALGYQVDDGALESNRNIEKLLRKRIDGYAVSLVSASDMDRVIAANFGERVVRMDKPLRVNNIWLALSKGYYDRNPKQAERMWNWIGTQGHVRFAQLVKKYENER